MKSLKNYLGLFTIPVCFIFLLNITGCNKENSVTEASSTENEYIQNEAIQSTDGSNDDDNEILGNETIDFEGEGAVADIGFDSLKMYGRRVTGVSTSVTFTIDTDTLKTVAVKRTITGNFIIKGYIGLALDSVSKPYIQEQIRTAAFKRVGRSNAHRRNWKLYQVSAVDGHTTSPQAGKSNITMTKIEIYKNSTLALTLNGPDFTTNVFTTRFLNTEGMLKLHRGDDVRVKVFATSNQSDTDIVAFHWARNTFGFHRVPFTMTSQTQVGANYDRTYEKTFTVYSNHRFGIFNSYISANTKSSIWNNSTGLFSSTYAGMPYRISF